MARIEPFLIPVISDLVQGLREIGVDFCLVGALVPEILLNVRPRRMTNDVDVTVVVETLTDFERLKARLAAFGFRGTRLSYPLAASNRRLAGPSPLQQGHRARGSAGPRRRHHIQHDRV